MAQLTKPSWLPKTDNPLPKCKTTVTVTVTPNGGPATGIRIRYKLRGNLVRFVLPSPGPAGSTIVSQTPNELVEDHVGFGLPAPITRTIELESNARPALETMDVFVADIVSGMPDDERSSTDSISFALLAGGG